MSYLDAGFNQFFCRSIASNSAVSTLQQMSHVSGSNGINFDKSSTSGSLGDKIQVGKILLDGSKARIDLQGVDSQDVVIRLGELDV